MKKPEVFKRINWRRAITVAVLLASTVHILQYIVGSCTGEDSVPRTEIEEHLLEYEELRLEIAKNQKNLGERWIAEPAKRNLIERQASEYTLQMLRDRVFPAWYGTTWDFNGTTEKPKKGKVACGYFVSTTLKHTGFDVERFKLAQQASSLAVKTLCPEKTIKTLNKIEKLKSHLKAQKDGLFIVGLDKHIGFALKTNQDLFFVHSSSRSGKKVQREAFDECSVLARSKIFVVGNLTGDNPQLMQHWLQKTKITTITS